MRTGWKVRPKRHPIARCVKSGLSRRFSLLGIGCLRGCWWRGGRRGWRRRRCWFGTACSLWAWRWCSSWRSWLCSRGRRCRLSVGRLWLCGCIGRGPGRSCRSRKSRTCRPRLSYYSRNWSLRSLLILIFGWTGKFCLLMSYCLGCCSFGSKSGWLSYYNPLL